MKRGLSMSIADAEAHQRRHGFIAGPLIAPETPVAAAKALRGSRQPNKTESEFGRILEAQKQRGEVIEYAFEPFNLMYGDNAFYKPDWVARTGGSVSIEALARLCRLRVIDMAADASLWRDYTDLVRGVYFTITEVKGGRIFPEAFPRFKAAKLRHQWASFELHQKTSEGWRRLL